MDFAPLSKLWETNVLPAAQYTLGHCACFEDVSRITGSDDTQTLSGMDVYAMLVLNNSGGLLLPGARAIWDNSSTHGPGKAVGAAAGDNVVGAGVVPADIVSTGVPDQHTFWLIRSGPCKAISNGDNLAIRAFLGAGADGEAKTSAAVADQYGIALEAFDVDGTLYRAIVNFDNHR